MMEGGGVGRIGLENLAVNRLGQGEVALLMMCFGQVVKFVKRRHIINRWHATRRRCGQTHRASHAPDVGETNASLGTRDCWNDRVASANSRPKATPPKPGRPKRRRHARRPCRS